jgi:hypothetical protein
MSLSAALAPASVATSSSLPDLYTSPSRRNHKTQRRQSLIRITRILAALAKI